jgi:hypothetical protein
MENCFTLVVSKILYSMITERMLYLFLFKQAILIQIDNKTSRCLLDFGPGKIFELHITFTREQPERV